MVSEKGIKANPKKIRTVMEMTSPKLVKEMQRLVGKLASLNRFISRFADKNLPYFNILRNVKDFKWIDECQAVLQELKKYLTSPPLLAKPKHGEPLFLYEEVSKDAMSSVLVREERCVQNWVYYVSKMLQGAEKRYLQVEKLALAFVTTTRKLRP